MSWLLNLKAYVFDLDGTLIDTEKAHLKAWSRALSTFLEKIDISLVQRHFGKSGKDIALLVLGDERRARECEKLKEKIFDELWPIEAKLMPCAENLLMTLRRMGVKTAVASSNSLERITRILKHFRLLGLFDTLVGLEEVMEHKPSPDLLLRAVSKLNVKPSEAVYVGDSPYDVLMAMKAGSRSILVEVYERISLEEVGASPDMRVKSLCELCEALFQ